MYAVRTRISIRTEDGPTDATVFHAGKEGARILGDDGETYVVPPGAARPPATTPVPEALAGRVDELVAAWSRIWKKGDRASIDDGGEILHGTIHNGGAKPTMLIDGRGGAAVSAPSGEFREGRLLEAEPPSPMDRWSVARYRPVKALSEETTAYTADILLDGQVVISASNEGRGGCDTYHPVGGATWKVVDLLAADAKAWYAEHGIEALHEPEGSWVHFAGAEKPMGVRTVEHMETMREIFDPAEDAAPASPLPRP